MSSLIDDFIPKYNPGLTFMKYTVGALRIRVKKCEIILSKYTLSLTLLYLGRQAGELVSGQLLGYVLHMFLIVSG